MPRTPSTQSRRNHCSNGLRQGRRLTPKAASRSPAETQASSFTGRYTYQPLQQQPGVVNRIFKWLLG